MHESGQPGPRIVSLLGFRSGLTVDGSRDQRIAAIAARQRGYVARRQLLEAGIGYHAIARCVAVGRLHPCHRGVYAVGHDAEPPLGPETAALLALRDGAVLSHRTAAALWGLQRAVPPDSLLHVVVEGNQAAALDTVRVHRTVSLDSRDARIRKSLPVTSPARTIIDLVPHLSDRQLEFTVDQAITERLVRPADLRRALERLTHTAGRSRLLELLRGDGTHASVTRSWAEERLLALIRAAGLPEPLINTRVAGYEVDFYWPRARVAVEVDGFQFHSTRPRLERDRRKDEDLREAGIATLRVTCRQLERSGIAVAVRIGQAIARADAASG